MVRDHRISIFVRLRVGFSTEMGLFALSCSKAGRTKVVGPKSYLYLRRSVTTNIQGGGYLVSVSVALLLLRLGSVTPIGAVALVVLESGPCADALIVPWAV